MAGLSRHSVARTRFDPISHACTRGARAGSVCPSRNTVVKIYTITFPRPIAFHTQSQIGSGVTSPGRLRLDGNLQQRWVGCLSTLLVTFRYVSRSYTASVEQDRLPGQRQARDRRKQADLPLWAVPENLAQPSTMVCHFRALHGDVPPLISYVLTAALMSRALGKSGWKTRSLLCVFVASALSDKTKAI